MYSGDKNINLFDKTLNDTMINAQSNPFDIRSVLLTANCTLFLKAIVSVANYRGLHSVTGGVTL